MVQNLNCTLKMEKKKSKTVNQQNVEKKKKSTMTTDNKDYNRAINN